MAGRIVAVLVILAAAAFVVYPANPCRTCEREIWDETLSEAAKCQFDYCRNYHAARAGDPEALQRLFEFSRETDAASSLGHGAALIRVAQSMGDGPFSSCIRRQPLEMRRRIGDFLELGMDYGLGRNPDEMAQLFPSCHQAVFEGTMAK
jgi:hypothetical protein